MQEGIIDYKFKSEGSHDVITFPGDSITVGELKDLIEDKRMRNIKRSC